MGNSKVEDKDRAKKRFWQTHIRAWEKSGLSQKEYCRRNTLKSGRFCYWKKKLLSHNPGTVKFVPIAVQAQRERVKPAHHDSGLTISLGKVSIKLNNDFNPSVLIKAVEALGGKL